MNGGAAAFTYDLARNVAYTRQGNPANRNLIPIPQADEQQRLLARLIQNLPGTSQPMPQLWYFPGSVKTMLIFTGDAHANPTSYYQPEINSLNAYGAKQTFYLSIAGELTDSQLQAWRAQGFEFGIHPNAYHPDTYPPYNVTNLVEGYQAAETFFSGYSSPKSQTLRNYQLAMSFGPMLRGHPGRHGLAQLCQQRLHRPVVRRFSEQRA